ncbi:hypothetical protein FWP33_13020 [Vibrio parahaemolyticus]|uniref:Uncharacterized protein n=1 Tax=Vibrio parahaemolyticus TaxID=670 RepID=A0A9Q3YGC6_VIBPH|nr:hypothetical protein [Vibrio parahaemolyticus]EGQ9743428.1 hypothetical protein [Vibrio parahaemolyticus]MCC3803879.1 hypothetical protein [Vibrio parahaemolyticus]
MELLITFATDRSLLFMVMVATGGVTAWYLSLISFFTCFHSLPVVKRIKLEGGNAPTAGEIKRFFGSISLLCICISVGCFATLVISLYSFMFNEAPQVTDSILNITSIVLDGFSYREWILASMFIIAMICSVPLGYFQGIRSTFAAQR